MVLYTELKMQILKAYKFRLEPTEQQAQ
ncbi:helix-turn-helix domain-containing protein, partial [Klebsiella quasipneumoniae]